MKYLIQNVVPDTGQNAVNSRVIEADEYSFDPQSGRHSFSKDGKLIAALLNVNVEPAPEVE